MPTDKIVIGLFCMIDDGIGAVRKRRDALLYPSEIVTLALDSQANVAFFTVLDTYGIELIHPCREGHGKRRIEKKAIRIVDGSWASIWLG